MALTYATMGAIVKASEQTRNLSRSYCPEKAPSRVTPVNGATVHLSYRVVAYLTYNRFAVSV